MSDPPPRATPTQLAEFEIIRRLGIGGMAEVFLAKKRGAEGTYKLLVVKRILPAHTSSRRFQSMFAEEAQLATRLNHPNIVQVYEFQDYGDEGQLLSMEYVEGPDLRKLVLAARSKEVRVPPFVAAYVLGEVAKGLHYAHERKDEGGERLDIVHRDVSPQNILLSFDGAVKIADFGIATANLFREEPGVLKGKTGYMSPEQARGEKVDCRTDIYSLGVVLHEVLTGRPLHGSASEGELLALVRDGNVQPPSLYAPGVPEDLEAIVMRALSREKEDRFQNARDFAAALTRVLFQHKELVDSQVLEGVISQLVSREHTSPGVALDESADGGDPGELSADSAVGNDSNNPDRNRVEERRLRAKSGREVRHVAVVSLRLKKMDELAAAMGFARAAQFSDLLRATLDEIAFKRGARWSWEDREVEQDGRKWSIATGARAVLGLLANPAGASAEAAWLAVDVHEAIQGACDGMSVELWASVGIVRGIATGSRDLDGHLIRHHLEKSADYLADALGERAPEGQTWVAGGLYRLVRREFVWGDAPTIELPDAEAWNLPGNMRIYALKRPLTRQERLQQAANAPRDLIGRDAELGDLHAAYHRAVSVVSAGPLSKVTSSLYGSASGDTDRELVGRMVSRVVVGEMGIGKTALVSTFLTELPPDARVLRIECSPVRSEVPYYAVGQCVRELTGIHLDQLPSEASELIRTALGEFASGESGEDIVDRLASLVTGRMTPAQDQEDAVHHKHLLASGLRRFLLRAALDAPLVMVVEGVQWADLASLELLTSIISRTDPLPILTIFVTRPDQRTDARTEGLVRIDLRALSSDKQIRLVQAHVEASEGVGAACRELLPRAAGNPFFLLEIVDALLERGLLEVVDLEDGGAELRRTERAGEHREALPSTLEQLIADRLNELPPQERRVVSWLAVSGGPLEESDLAELAGASDDAVIRLCARGLCDARGDAVDVRHPLTRDVAYLGLEMPERVAMHKQLGEFLLKTPAAEGLNAAIVARHLAYGGAVEQAADCYLEAARAAQSSYQLSYAIRYFRQGLDILPPDNFRRMEALSALENIFRIQGRSKERETSLAELRRSVHDAGSSHWAAIALIRTARFDLDAGNFARGLALSRQAETVARQAGSSTLEVEAQALMAETLRDLGDMQGALAACDRALETASHSRVPSRLRADVLRARGTLLLRVGRVQEAVDAQIESIGVFRQVGARRAEARAKNALAFAMLVQGRFEDTIALALESIRIDLSIGGRFQVAKTLSNIGQSYARLGDGAQAIAYLSRARDAHQLYGDQDGRADTLLVSAEVLMEFGEVSQAETFVGDAGALSAVTGSAYDSVHEKILRAIVARHAGDSGSAVMHAFDARQVAEAQAYVAFHFYAMAIESVARVEVGEQHTGVLLATTAMGAIETVQGSEYGLETRALCCDALRLAGSPQLDILLERAQRFTEAIRDSIREPSLREGFVGRALVDRLIRGSVSEAAPPNK
ncbi:MAG: protein kinase [Polyangiaceae bacterium]|nr:protein kinase [Polyangiaceae bacterium]